MLPFVWKVDPRACVRIALSAFAVRSSRLGNQFFAMLTQVSGRLSPMADFLLSEKILRCSWPDDEIKSIYMIV